MALTAAASRRPHREHRVVVPFNTPVAGMSELAAVLIEGPSGWGEITTPPPGYPVDPRAGRRAAEEAGWGTWPSPRREQVVVNALVAALAPEEAAASAAGAAAAGFTCVKIKIGDEGSLDRVAAVREAVGSGVAVRVDANGAWDVDDAVSRLTAMSSYDLELAEQPVASLDDLARVRRRVPMPVAADECVRALDDAHALARLDAADAVVLKVQPLGGVAAAMAVGEAAAVPAVVSSLYETSVGIAAGLALAAALPDLPWACGLGTAALLAGDVVVDPLVPVDGRLVVRRPVPDAALLDRYEA